MLIAAQMSFIWIKEEPIPKKKEIKEGGEKCPNCNTQLLSAPGIGSYCPNKDCYVIDNIKNWQEEKKPVQFKFEEKIIEVPIFKKTVIEDQVMDEPTVEVETAPIVEEVQELKGRPIDLLYNEYTKDKFEGIVVDIAKEPELAKFIEQNKEKPRFNNYSQDILRYYARRIHELRKNNGNNTAG